MKTFSVSFIMILGLITITCFTSCFYGYKTRISTSAINKFKGDSIEYFREVILYEGACTLPDTAYTRIAKIKVEGKEYSTENDLMEMLRQQAFKLGANAVIEVKAGTEERMKGSGLIALLALFDNSVEFDTQVYNATVLTGVAVYIKD